MIKQIEAAWVNPLITKLEVRLTSLGFPHETRTPEKSRNHFGVCPETGTPQGCYVGFGNSSNPDGPSGCLELSKTPSALQENWSGKWLLTFEEEASTLCIGVCRQTLQNVLLRTFDVSIFASGLTLPHNIKRFP